MKNTAKSIVILGAMLCLILLSGGERIAFAGETVTKPYVDMDGDGFDDNASDEDGDAIPDAADPDYVPAPAEDENMSGLINFGETLKEVGIVEDFSTNMQKFDRLDFHTRAMAQNRCGFDAGEEFGSEGIGIGGSSGGGCVGGVCR